MRYRLIYAGLALTGVAAVALGVVLGAEGEPLTLPEPLEGVHPTPGSLAPLQTAIEVDLPNGYKAEIVVDGQPVRNASFTEATGVYRWSPGSDDPAVQEWAPGEHKVTVTWDTYAGRPDPGSFEWAFRVG